MATRITSERPKVTRVVAGVSKYAHKIKEIVVSVVFAPQGGMIELRGLKHRQKYSILVKDLFDQLMYKEAMRQAQEARKRRRSR